MNRLWREYEYPKGRVEFSAVVKAVKVGHWNISARARGEGIPGGGIDRIYISVFKDKATVSDSPPLAEDWAFSKRCPVVNESEIPPRMQPPAKRINIPKPAKHDEENLRPLPPSFFNLSTSDAPNASVSPNTLIKENKIRRISNSGIFVARSSDTQIIDNSVLECYPGISVDYTDNLEITGNTVDRNWGGIWLRFCNNSYIADNLLYRNPDFGFCLASSENSEISRNRIKDNSIGFVFDRSSNVEVHDNNIYDNNYYGAFNSDPDPLYKVNATYNWWGSSDGPGGEGPGNGDKVSANIEYDPWLHSEYDS